MANPKLPGIPEAEQALLYAKLNEYNRGRMSYKEAGAYFVVLPRPGHPTYSVWIYSPTLEKNRLLFIHELSADINESLRMASTLFYKYTPKIPKQERFVAIAQVYHSVHLDIMQRKARQKREAGRFLGNEGEKLEGLNLKVVRVRLEDDPYKTRVMGTSVQFFVRQIVTLTDPSGNLVVLRISSKTPSPVSCQLPALEHEFRPGEIVHIASARIARTYESYGSKYTRLSHVKFLIGT